MHGFDDLIVLHRRDEIRVEERHLQFFVLEGELDVLVGERRDECRVLERLLDAVLVERGLHGRFGHPALGLLVERRFDDGIRERQFEVRVAQGRLHGRILQ